jgi:hypothetical protein
MQPSSLTPFLSSRLYSTISAMNPPPANRDALKRQIRSVIFLESAIDLVNTLLVDVEGWNRDRSILEWAWKVHVHGEDPDDDEMERLTTVTWDLTSSDILPINESNNTHLTSIGSY